MLAAGLRGGDPSRGLVHAGDLVDQGAYLMALAIFRKGDPHSFHHLFQGRRPPPAGSGSRRPSHGAECLPDGLGHPGALPLAVVRQAPDEVDEVQAAAEDAAHSAQQHQLAVVGRGRAQSALQLLHHLKGTQECLLTAPSRLDSLEAGSRPDTASHIYRVARDFLLF